MFFFRHEFPHEFPQGQCLLVIPHAQKPWRMQGENASLGALCLMVKFYVIMTILTSIDRSSIQILTKTLGHLVYIYVIIYVYT